MGPRPSLTATAAEISPSALPSSPPPHLSGGIARGSRTAGAPDGSADPPPSSIAFVEDDGRSGVDPEAVFSSGSLRGTAVVSCGIIQTPVSQSRTDGPPIATMGPIAAAALAAAAATDECHDGDDERDGGSIPRDGDGRGGGTEDSIGVSSFPLRIPPAAAAPSPGRCPPGRPEFPDDQYALASGSPISATPRGEDDIFGENDG